MLRHCLDKKRTYHPVPGLHLVRVQIGTPFYQTRKSRVRHSKLLPENIRCKGDLFYKVMLEYCPDKKFYGQEKERQNLNFYRFLSHLTDACERVSTQNERVNSIVDACKLTRRKHANAPPRDCVFFSKRGAPQSACKGDLCLKALATYRPNLKHVDLRSWYGVEDEGLAMLVEKCLKLHPDKIISDEKGDAFVFAVAKHRPDLESINLKSCPVSEKALISLLEHCKNM